jgi:hypothetical protein
MRTSVRIARFAVDPPVSGAQAAFGALPGLVVGVAVADVVGAGVLGAGVGVRVGVAVGAAVVGAALGLGVRRTVSSRQSPDTSRVSRKSTIRAGFRGVICSN